MLTIDKLNDFGANTSEGLKRCLNMESFYLDLVKTAMNDEQLVKLGKAIENNDYDQAFEITHSLKGVYSNLSLTPLCEPISEMTELFRSKTQADYKAMYDLVMQRFNEFCNL